MNTGDTEGADETEHTGGTELTRRDTDAVLITSALIGIIGVLLLVFAITTLPETETDYLGENSRRWPTVALFLAGAVLTVGSVVAFAVRLALPAAMSSSVCPECAARARAAGRA